MLIQKWIATAFSPRIKLLDDLKEAFEDIKQGKVKSHSTVKALFKDLDAGEHQIVENKK